MDGLSLDFQKDFQPFLLKSAGEGPPLVLSGRTVAMWDGGVGWPPFMDVAGGPAGDRFIGPSASESKALTTKHAFLKQTTMPADIYPG